MQEKPWYLSRTIWGAIILLLSTILRGYGVDISDLDSQIVNQILDAVGLAMVIAGRVTASRRLTK